MSEIPTGESSILKEKLKKYFDMRDIILNRLSIPVNDVIEVITSSGRFALKLYNTKSRTYDDVQWELDLIVHLMKHGAPVVKPVAGSHGYVETYSLDGQDRVGALFEWIPGKRAKPDRSTYILLGRAAAQIHQAADTFRSTLARDSYDYDAHVLIDEQLQLMKQHLSEANSLQEAVELGERLKTLIANPSLDRGICHMDLTLSNVRRNGNELTVFDFDSSGRSWRSIEPFGVLRYSKDYFRDWLEGYRSVRSLSQNDENAVAAFSIIGDVRTVAWKLGVAQSSRGKPLLTAASLPKVVDDWLSWEREHILNHP